MMDDPNIELPPLPEEQREIISMWMQQRLNTIEQQHQARIELLRTAGEHPSPIFASMVKQFGSIGLSKNLCAKMLGVSVAILNSHYEDDYDIGKAETVSSVAANMVRIATSVTDPSASKVGMQILDRQGGPEWLPPTKKIDMSHDRDKPPVIDSSKLTYEQRQQLRAMIMHVQSGGEGEPIGQDEDPVIP